MKFTAADLFLAKLHSSLETLSKETIKDLSKGTGIKKDKIKKILADEVEPTFREACLIAEHCNFDINYVSTIREVLEKEDDEYTDEAISFEDGFIDGCIVRYENTDTNFHLIGTIDEYKLAHVANWLRNFRNMPEEKRPEYITLNISSNGGCVDNANSIIDLMEQSVIPVRTHVVGYAASSAVTIAITGQQGHRTATKNATLMTHEVSLLASGYKQAHQVQESIEELHRVNLKAVDHYQKYTGKQRKYIIDKILVSAKDTFFTPEEAIKSGLIDSIIV